MPPSPENISPATSCLGSRGLPVFHRTQIPAVYKEPFIIAGYRKPDCSYAECFKYAFVFHNDVGNFWTHFIPLLIWLSWLYWLSFQIDFSDPYFYPLLCFWLGACTYAAFSSMAHLVACKSFTVRSVAFMMDYLGIMMYAFGGGLTSFFYQPPLGSFWFKYKWILLAFTVIFCVNATVMCSLSRFFCVKQRFVIRTLAFTVPYLTVVSPFLHRLQVCATTGKDCVYETLNFHFLGFVFTFVLTFFFVTKIPERFAPGKFDYVGQSHQLFHIAAAALTCTQMYIFPRDAMIRRENLANIPDFSPDFNSTFLLYILVQVLGLLTITIFCVLVVKKILISNKKDVLQDVIRREAAKAD